MFLRLKVCWECYEWIEIGMNSLVRKITGIERELASTVNQRVLRLVYRRG